MNRFSSCFKFGITLLSAFLVASCASTGSSTNSLKESSPQIKFDNIYFDRDTKLIWTPCYIGQEFSNGQCIGDPYLMTRNEAIDYSKSYSYAGVTNWTPPSFSEAFTLLNCKVRERTESSIRFQIYSITHICEASFLPRSSVLKKPLRDLNPELDKISLIANFNSGIGSSDRSVILDLKKFGTGSSYRTKSHARQPWLFVSAELSNVVIDQAIRALTWNGGLLYGAVITIFPGCNDERAVYSELDRSSKTRLHTEPTEYEIRRMRSWRDASSQSNIAYELVNRSGEISYISISHFNMASGFSITNPESYFGRLEHLTPIFEENECKIIRLPKDWLVEKYQERKEWQHALLQRTEREAEAERLAKAEADRIEAEERKKSAAEFRRLSMKPSPVIGMTMYEVKHESNWGAPIRTRRSETANLTITYWEYSNYGTPKFLVFHNGRLAQIHR